MNGAQKLFVGGVVATTVVWAIVAHARRPVHAHARHADLGASPAYTPAASSWVPAEDDADWEVPQSPATPEEPPAAQEPPTAQEPPVAQEPPPPEEGRAAFVPAHGLSLAGDRFEFMDWNAWMETAPTMLRATLSEGTRDPEQIVANLFRRLFPESAWPPPQDSPLIGTWNKMVATVGRSLERPFKPHLEIVS